MSQGTLDLTDPVSNLIIVTPVRGVNCTHPECFDLDTWVAHESTSCTFCFEAINRNELVEDLFIKELLRRLPRVTKVKVDHVLETVTVVAALPASNTPKGHMIAKPNAGEPVPIQAPPMVEPGFLDSRPASNISAFDSRPKSGAAYDSRPSSRMSALSGFTSASADTKYQSRGGPDSLYMDIDEVQRNMGRKGMQMNPTYGDDAPFTQSNPTYFDPDNPPGGAAYSGRGAPGFQMNPTYGGDSSFGAATSGGFQMNPTYGADPAITQVNATYFDPDAPPPYLQPNPTYNTDLGPPSIPTRRPSDSSSTSKSFFGGRKKSSAPSLMTASRRDELHEDQLAAASHTPIELDTFHSRRPPQGNLRPPSASATRHASDSSHGSRKSRSSDVSKRPLVTEPSTSLFLREPSHTDGISYVASEDSDDNAYTHRPWFMALITCVEVGLLVWLLVVYGLLDMSLVNIGPYDIPCNSTTSTLIAPAETNIWIGPSQRVLISHGAVFQPCMVANTEVASYKTYTTVSTCVNSGACCTTLFGTCQKMTASRCSALNGVYHGDNTSCASVDCLAQTCGFGMTSSSAPNQWYRVLIGPFFHVGIIHLIVVGFVQLIFGWYVEGSAGFFFTATLYITSAITSAVVASIFLPYAVIVGAGGAMSALLGARFIILILEGRRGSGCCSFCCAFIAVLFFWIGYIGATLLPYIYMFECFAGFFYGCFFTLVFHPIPSANRSKAPCMWFLALLIYLASTVAPLVIFFMTIPSPSWCGPICQILACIYPLDSDMCLFVYSSALPPHPS